MKSKGFGNLAKLQRHFAKHGREFGALTALEYEEMADGFLTVGRSATIYECTRTGGAFIRFDSQTDAFGVLDTNGIILTFFKLVPCASIPNPQRAAIQMAGMCHASATNLLYFRTTCK